MRHTGAFLLVALAGAALDLLTKHLAFVHVPLGGEVTVIDGLFSFGRTLNKGVIFGIGTRAPAVWLVISVLAVPAILAIFFSVRRPRWPMTIALGLILAGTIGNMYDRVFTDEHAVRDFIKFYTRTAEGPDRVWPLFNLADSSICVGVFLLSVEMVFFDESKKKRRAPAPSLAPGALPAAEPPMNVPAKIDAPTPPSTLPGSPTSAP